MRYDIGVKVFGDWTLMKEIGQGSYGRVFAAQRENNGIRNESAIKVITIPRSESELQSVLSEGMDEASVTAYFQAFVQEIITEILTALDRGKIPSDTRAWVWKIARNVLALLGLAVCVLAISGGSFSPFIYQQF